MPTILHRHLGAMDLDSPDQVIAKGFHRTARNGIFRGTPGNYRWECVNGTTLIPNSLLPVSGVNMTICAKYDPNKQRLFIFNYNSSGSHGIYIYYTQTTTFVRLIETGINTNGDPLAFLPYPRIYGVDILYGDGNAGDLLFFIDSLKRPRKLNIDRLLNGGYVNITDNFLKVIKAPPQLSPQVAYENDYTVTSNQLLNCLWQFAYTWIYDDNEESVISTASIVPLPTQPFNALQNLPIYQNARIGTFLQTGDQNVSKIRLYGRQQTSGGNSGWMVIDTLIKSSLGINNNTIYKYLFYGNGNYVTVDPAFSVQLFDSVPQKANDECLLNGNTMGYGGITEGYDYFNPNISISNTNVNVPQFTNNGSLFFAQPNGVFVGGQPQITLYLTGSGTNDGLGNPTSIINAPANFYIRAKSGATDIGFSVTSNTSNSVTTILSALSSAATTAGWTVSATGTNSLTIYYPTGNVVLNSWHTTGIIPGANYVLNQLSFLPQSAYQWGAIYFDADGRTNGVISSLTAKTTTPSFASGSTQIPQVTLSLNYVPPEWAVYWRPVRTDNLTYQKWVQWISTSANANSLATAAQQFGYLGITNFAAYNQTIISTQNVVSYSFSPGDRVRITGRYASDGITFTPIDLDYAILGTVTNPIANGVEQNGLYLQIAYPSADIGTNFKLDGSDDFQNYQLTIYSYKSVNPTGTNVFYEMGITFGIGNPGTPSAYHMGNISDNQVSLTDGDVFFRTRQVPITSTYFVPTGTFIQGFPFPGPATAYSTLWWNPGSGGTPVVNNSVYEIVGDVNKVAGLASTQYPTFADTPDIFNKSLEPLTVNITFDLFANNNGTPAAQFSALIKIMPSSNIPQILTILPLQTGLATNDQKTYNINATFTMPANSKAWIITNTQNNVTVSTSPLQITFTRDISINVFDYSFSDVYELRTNSDNRPDVVDTTALQTFYSTLFRFGENYQLGTNINNTNRFYANNFDEFSKQYGSIIRMVVAGREMLVFQYRRCGHVGIYQKFIKNNNGETNLIVTDTIITPNNIQYFEGEYGIGNQPDSLCTSGYRHYFADPVKGYWCRLSLNGIEPITELYKVQTWAGANLSNYLSNYAYPFGGNSVILGVFNFAKDRDSEAMLVLQPGTVGAATIVGETIAFNESKDLFTSFYDFAPDAIVCCENTLYSLYNGQLYAHTNDASPANFYSTQYPCNITIPFNEQMAEKKTFISVEQIANDVWECPSIYTNQISYGSTPQQSNLVAEDFRLLDSTWNASLWRDINSQKGQFNGDALKGNLAVVQFQVGAPSGLVFLSDVLLTYIDNRRTNR